jgi:alpha-glucosidase
LPGAVFIYNGEELGLPNVDLPDAVLQDPVWERSGQTERGRDGCRVPLPWSGDTPPYGFSSTAETWLPMPPDWGPLTVQTQADDPDSTLTLFRRAIELRQGRTQLGKSVHWLPAARNVLGFAGEDGLVCLLNTGTTATKLPAGAVLVASGPLPGGTLPPDTAVWLAPHTR